MKNPSPREAITLAAIDRAARVERNRAGMWEMLDLRDRQRAVGVAGLARERASEPLEAFTDAERHMIRIAIARHLGQMELIATCMAGGAFSPTGGLLH